jgi:hypothetical protein
MYRLIARAVLRQKMDLVLVGYTVYTGQADSGHVDHQVRHTAFGCVLCTGDDGVPHSVRVVMTGEVRVASGSCSFRAWLGHCRFMGVAGG